MKLSQLKVKNPYSGENIKLTNIMSLLSLVLGAGVIGLAFAYGSRLAGKVQGYIDTALNKNVGGQVEEGPRKVVGL